MSFIRFTSLSLVLLSVQLCVGQSDYAILTNGDTLRGEMKLIIFENLDRLQINVDGKKANYTSLQVKSYRKEGKRYESVKYSNTYRFMRVIKSGYLSLFAFNTTLSPTWDGLYLKKMDDTGREVPNLGFRKILSNYLSDCPTIQSKIQKGEIRKSELNDIVDLYNNCIEAKTAPVTNTITKAPTEKINLVQSVIDNVNAEEFLTKKDALEVLNEVKSKVAKGETIPNFLFESLKSYLLDKPDLLKKAEDLITLLKK
jgi:hypothetical protein